MEQLMTKFSEMGQCVASEDEADETRPGPRKSRFNGKVVVGAAPNPWLFENGGLLYPSDTRGNGDKWDQLVDPVLAAEFNTEVTAEKVQLACQDSEALDVYRELLRRVVGLDYHDHGNSQDLSVSRRGSPPADPEKDAAPAFSPAPAEQDSHVFRESLYLAPGQTPPSSAEVIRRETLVRNLEKDRARSDAERAAADRSGLAHEEERTRLAAFLLSETERRLALPLIPRAEPALRPLTAEDWAPHSCDVVGCKAFNAQDCAERAQAEEDRHRDQRVVAASSRALELQWMANLVDTGSRIFASSEESTRWEEEAIPSVTMQYGALLRGTSSHSPPVVFDPFRPVNRADEEYSADAKRALQGLPAWTGPRDTNPHPPFIPLEEFRARASAPPEGLPSVTGSTRSPANPALQLARNPTALGRSPALALLRLKGELIQGITSGLNETVRSAVQDAVAPLKALFQRNGMAEEEPMPAEIAESLSVWLGPCVTKDTENNYSACCNYRWPKFLETQPDYGLYLERLRSPMAKALQIVLYAKWRYETAARRAEQIDADITALKWMFAHNPPFDVSFFKLDVLAKARNRYMRNEEEVVLYNAAQAKKQVSIVPSEFLPTLQSTHFRGIRVDTTASKDDLTKYACCLALHLASNTGARLGHYAVSKKSQRNLVKAGQMLFWVGDPNGPTELYEWVSGAITGLATYFHGLGSKRPVHHCCWVHQVHYQINTSKTVGSVQGQKAKTTRKQVRTVSIGRASNLASTTLDMLVNWCVAMPLGKMDPLLTIYRSDLKGKHSDAQTATIKLPGHPLPVVHIRRLLAYSDVTAAIKLTVMSGPCGYLDPRHFTTRSIRRTFLELSGTVMSRSEALLLAQWSENSLVPENYYKQDGVLVGALDRLTDEGIDRTDCSAARIMADLAESARQRSFLQEGFEAEGHAPVRGLPSGYQPGLVLGQRFADRPEEIASGEADHYHAGGEDTHQISEGQKKIRKSPWAGEDGKPKPGSFTSTKGKARRTSLGHPIPIECLEVRASTLTIGGPEGPSPGRGLFLREGFSADNGQVVIHQLGKVVSEMSLKDMTYASALPSGRCRDSREEALTGECWFSMANSPNNLWDAGRNPPRLLRSDDANCHWKTIGDEVVMYFTENLYAVDGPIELLRVYGSGYGYPPNHNKKLTRQLAEHRLCISPLAYKPRVRRAAPPVAEVINLDEENPDPET